MNQSDLDQMDAAIALLEGTGIATLDAEGKAVRGDRTPYRPTRDRGEAMRLMDKYIVRMAKLNGAWAAVGADGRAHLGPTSLIAICRAVVSNPAMARDSTRLQASGVAGLEAKAS